MGYILSYSLISSVVLLFCYLPYRWFMGNRKQYGFNRLIILAIYGLSVISAFLLFSDFPASENINNIVSIGVPNSQIRGYDNIHADDGGYLFGKILVIAYYIGLSGVLLSYLWGIVRILFIIRRSQRINEHGNNIVISDNDKVAPFSWGNLIIMSKRLYESDNRWVVIAHESAHIRKLHWVDLLFSQIMICFMWYNPVAWMLRDCLKEIHEFQADDSVLMEGVDPRRYQLFLVSYAFSSQFNLPVDFLNAGSIRKRIYMMNKGNTADKRCIAVVVLFPFLSIGLLACNLPPVRIFVDQIQAVDISEGNYNESISSKSIVKQENNDADQSVEKIAVESEQIDGIFEEAEYYEGKMALMKFLMNNVKYPKEAEQHRMEGKVVVSFQLSDKGEVMSICIAESVDKYLDEEALRVCGKISKFKPALLNGVPVSSTYNLPITFKLSPN